MDANDVTAFREVDEGQFVGRFNQAMTAVRRAEFGNADDRWAGAGEEVCGLLTFVRAEEPLWLGLHQAIDALEGSRDEIHEVRDRLKEFVDAEYNLLTRRGLSEAAAGQIVNTVVLGLISFDNPEHAEIEQTRAALDALTESLCGGVEDWSVFAEPERRANRHVNTIAVLGGTGGVLGAASNAVGLVVPPLLVGSIAGGLVAGIASFLGYRRRRR